MKRLILSVTILLIFILSSFAQNSIQLNIHHKLGDVDFALETGAINNLDNDFEVTRLEYYISQIAIIHDGGSVTVFDELWVLVNAAELTQIDLGDTDINTIEMLRLNIGVNESHNHLDPSTYPASHPLAPKNPSMHWGWSSGYRFVALEGNGGSNFDQLFELHGLGDINYSKVDIPMNLEVSNNEVIINIDADYTGALEDIDVNSGVIVHGDYAEAQQCVRNFRSKVFSLSDQTTSAIDFSEVSKFEVFPNPANGNATLNLETTENLNYQVSVTDILGKQVLFFDTVNSNSTIDLSLTETGFYFINLIKEGKTVITKKLFSK